MQITRRRRRTRNRNCHDTESKLIQEIERDVNNISGRMLSEEYSWIYRRCCVDERPTNEDVKGISALIIQYSPLPEVEAEGFPPHQHKKRVMNMFQNRQLNIGQKKIQTPEQKQQKDGYSAGGDLFKLAPIKVLYIFLRHSPMSCRSLGFIQ